MAQRQFGLFGLNFAIVLKSKSLMVQDYQDAQNRNDNISIRLIHFLVCSLRSFLQKNPSKMSIIGNYQHIFLKTGSHIKLQ